MKYKILIMRGGENMATGLILAAILLFACAQPAY